ncbi:MAG: hypothetical protein Ta2E_11640 [Mycoplasmoidaceae bacterium]|nr:MAG: hypothetical protein Ta2E_11640 [Mycoplasmoidaceae bacterium]
MPINKPISDFRNSLIGGLVWSDPLSWLSKFVENKRGKGYLFGENQIQYFLQDNSLKMLIRGHQCTPMEFNTL